MGGELTIDGETAQEFLEHLFQFEFCAECHGDEKDHDAVVILGHWFAVCQRQGMGLDDE